MAIKRIDKIEDKLDIIGSEISQINKTLATNTVQLEEHMRRTAASEDRLVFVENHVIGVQSGIKVILKIISGLAVFLTLLLGVVQIFHP